MRITFAIATLAAAAYAVNLELQLETEALLNDDWVATTDSVTPIVMAQ